MKSFPAPTLRYASLVLFALAAVPVAASCQAASSPAAAKPAPAADYSHESSVIESMETVYTYAADGSGTNDITSVIEIHDDAAIKAWSVINVPFASSAEHVDVIYPPPSASPQAQPLPASTEC